MSRIETYNDRYKGAKVLVEGFPLNATQFIADNFETKEITDYIKKCCTTAGVDFWQIMHNSGSSQPSSKLPRIKTRRISSPSSSGTTPLNLPFAPMPPSPALTSSTGTSQTCKPPEETIVIFEADGASHPLISRPACVAESWIRADIVYNRLKGVPKPCETSTGVLSVLYKDVPSRVLTAKEQISLTWKRKESGRTHFTTFYLVDDLFDADILLGDFALAQIGLSNVAIGGRAQDQEDILHPKPQYIHGYNTQLNQFFQPPSQSNHQSDMFSSTVHSPVPGSLPSFNDSHRHNIADPAAFPNELLQTFAARQQRSPASAIYRPSGSPTTGPASSIVDDRTSTPTSKHTRVMFIWDGTRLGRDVDLAASSDIFWEALQMVFNRAKRRIDRSIYYLRFTADPKNDDADGFFLNLNESDLQNDWPEAVSWITANKRPQPPHLYAVVEHDCPD